MPRNARIRIRREAMQETAEMYRLLGFNGRAEMIEEDLEWLSSVTWARRRSGEMREYASRNEAVKAVEKAMEAYNERLDLRRTLAFGLSEEDRAEIVRESLEGSQEETTSS